MTDQHDPEQCATDEEVIQCRFLVFTPPNIVSINNEAARKILNRLARREAKEDVSELHIAVCGKEIKRLHAENAAALKTYNDANPNATCDKIQDAMTFAVTACAASGKKTEELLAENAALRANCDGVLESIDLIMANFKGTVTGDVIRGFLMNSHEAMRFTVNQGTATLSPRSRDEDGEPQPPIAGQGE